MKYILSAFLLTAAISGFAQTNKIKLSYRKSVNISPLALADVDNGLMAGAEYRFASNMSASLDVAYIFYSNYYQEAEESKGFNIRPAFRYYFGKRQHEFVQLQGFFKRVDYTMHGWIGKECVNNVPSYNQLQDYQIRKNVLGVNLMVGDILPVSPKAYFDLGMGIGVRFKKQNLQEAHACIPEQPQNFINRYTESVTTISLPFTVKFAYILD